MGDSGLEKGARVQIMLRRERGLDVKKEQGRMTESPRTTSTVDSLMDTLRASEEKK